MKKIIFFSILSVICARAQGQWQLTGNAGTNASTNFIGTIDNVSFKIRTKNTVRVTITAAGKVGIGTTSPVYKLDVKGGSINTDSVYRIKGNTVLSIKGDYNLFTGVSSGFSNTLGGANVGNGYQALYSNTEGNFNTASGYNAMQFNTIGYNNTAHGTNALLHNTTASENTAIGNSALFVQSYSNGGVDWISSNVAVGSFALFANQPTTTLQGIDNTAVGHSALRNNTIGSQNTAVGKEALYLGNSGFYNSAVGYQALYNNNANYNTAHGYRTLYSNTSGGYNTATGYEALYSNTAGSGNTAHGLEALFQNTTASGNTALGYQALFGQSFSNGGTSWSSNNTALGYQALVANSPTTNLNGRNNTAAGTSALHSNTNGTSNTAVGSSALYTNNGGNYNTALGYEALKNQTVAIDNCAVGAGAGTNFANGNWCTFVGAFADANAAGYANSTVIGEAVSMTASNQVRLGDGTVNSIGGYAGWTTLPSDRRFKKNIRENVPGLDFINRLRPVTYTLDVKGINSFLRTDDKASDKPGTSEKEKIIYTGFIAQDVENAAKEINYDFSGVDAPKNDKDIYGLRYAEFVVPLVKAVQELSHELDLIKNLLTEEQKQKLNEIKTEIIGTLEQNSPNPFNTQTEIKFRLPATFSSAQLIITDANGKKVRNVPIESGLKSSSSVIIKSSELSAGTYSYSLVIDGVNVDTKQMILTK